MEDKCDRSIFDMQRLEDIKERPDILEAIKLEVTPQIVMEPRFVSNPEDLQKLRDISGYMFYIETECAPPALMLMKVGKSDISKTVGKIDELPEQLVQDAINNPVHPPIYGMYAITDEIKSWLKKELGI